MLPSLPRPARLARLWFIVSALSSLLAWQDAAAQSACSSPPARLTGTDYVLLTTSTLFLASDWLLSVDAARRGGPNRETNVILGPHPSVGQHNTYAAIALVANIAVSRIPRPSLRRTVWVGVIAVEATTTLHMFSVGYHLNFRI